MIIENENRMGQIYDLNVLKKRVVNTPTKLQMAFLKAN